MILPGVSGGYLLLVLGAYIPVLAGIDECKSALKSMDISALMPPLLHVVLPIGIGVLIGVVVVSNLLRICLHRFENGTLGVLLGLLFGAVVGLWPFQQGVAPTPGSMFKGHEVVKLEPGAEWNGATVAQKDEGAVLEGSEEFYPNSLALVIPGDKESIKPAEPEDYPTEFFKPTPAQAGLAVIIIALGFLATSLIAKLSPKD
jgi:putative membrane protein